MSTPPPLDSPFTPEEVARLLALNGIVLAAADLAETTKHCALLHQHAAQVMGLALPELVEPAPTFVP